MRRFHDATGISDDDWGEYWAQYGDLQREAGYEPSTWPMPALEAEFVLEKYIALLRSLGRVPTDRELRQQRIHDPEFPSVKMFSRVSGTRRDLLDQVLQHCHGKPEYDDVAGIAAAARQAPDADWEGADASDEATAEPFTAFTPEQSAPARPAAPVWGQLDLRFEEASRMLDERLADVLRREAALEQSEQHLQHALARVEEQGAATTQREVVLIEKAAEARRTLAETEAKRSEVEQARAEVDEARRTLDERAAELAQREAALAQQPEEPQPVPVQADDPQAGQRLDERAAELARREATLVEVAQRVQRSLAETAAQRSQLEQGRAGVEEAERKVEERLAEVARREEQLAQQEQELRQAPAQPAAADDAELQQLRERHQEAVAALAQREAAIMQREAALVQQEFDVQQALAQAQADRGQSDDTIPEEARREIASLLASVAERERVVAERETHLEHALAQTGETFDLEARAQWLTDAVKTAARQEAETVVKEAREQAKRILADARAGQVTPESPPEASE